MTRPAPSPLKGEECILSAAVRPISGGRYAGDENYEGAGLPVVMQHGEMIALPKWLR
jgi:hypothetical protein